MPPVVLAAALLVWAGMGASFSDLREWARDPRHRTLVRAVGILAVLVVVIVVVIVGWYSFRVWTELGPRPWKNPTEITAHDGETILTIYGDVWQPAEPVTLEDLPEHIPNAFLAAEDVRFRRHIGVDPFGIARAAVANVKRGGIAQGGSTITQQVAKTRFLSADRTLRRKALEAIVAVLIELRLSKDDILSAYLNDVYLGHSDGRAVSGVDEAAKIYFDRKPQDLTIAQSAVLAAMVRAPNQDDVELLRKRRDAILDAMAEEEWLSSEELEEAKDDEIDFDKGSLPKARDRYFLRALRNELVEEIGARRLRGGGLRIQTSLDPAMQRAAVDAVVGGVDRLRSRYSWLRRSEDPLQAALLSVDPESGGVRALVGGTSYVKSQFDRTRSMKRQPGSAVKPFVYAAAIADGELTPATILSDSPVEIELSRNDIWKPRNYDEEFRGDVTVREAVEKSLNVPIVRVTDRIGTRQVRRMFDRAGLGEDFSNTPAVALGVDEVSMWDLVGAYTIFPNLGRRVEPHLVEKVETHKGRVIHEAGPRRRDVLDPPVAYVLHSLMRGVVERGTASALRGRGLGAIAGKTGTTSDYRDAWFVGYAPDLVTATWLGFDDGEPLRISSAEAALPLWSSYMKDVPHETRAIAPPEGVSIATVERATGLMWQNGCGSSLEEAFIAGTEPTERCQPSRRRDPEPGPFLEPSVISMEKLREWLQNAPGVGEIEIEEVPVEEAPPGLEPGDIVIETPQEGQQDPRDLPPIEQAPPEGDIDRQPLPPVVHPVDVPEPPDPAEAREKLKEQREEQKERREEQKERRKEQKEERREERREERQKERLDPPGRDGSGGERGRGRSARRDRDDDR
ncbi:MAG: PBP1A family penicillin-binding protein [Acidobacteria bacterium]|nr:PBP1A family penicillin-binding protein [Acidobacteriota bacterium]